MTSDGISSEDWDRLHDLALKIVNAPDDEDQVWLDELFRCLAQLREKYGEKASLLATEADYLEDRKDAERLFLKAFDIAISAGDADNISEIALSIADLYASELKDVQSASRWLEIAASHLPDDVDRTEYEMIAEALDRLKDSQ